jgi:hypothetical protein
MISGCAVLLATLQFANAQEQQQWRRFRLHLFRVGISVPQIAGLEHVQRELKLTEDQVAKVTEINEELRADRFEIMQGSQEDSRAKVEKIKELTKAATAKVDDTLDDAQKKRLQEISIQVNGAPSLANPDIAKALGITEDQRKRMAEVRAAFMQSMDDLGETVSNLTQEEIQAKLVEAREEVHKKLLAVLSDEQQAAFEKMKGAPFNPTPIEAN